ncbi:MAG: BMP family ABC transporter substrate-binding protein [Erysipelothrix sp.]|nr:BMP family ABC transporter substrate-binding protein [Erysipelothrix sp.]
MKKTFKFLVLATLVSLVLVACGGNGTTETEAKDPGFKAIIVLDTGGVDDKSFNESTWDGVQKFIADNGLDKNAFEYITSPDEASYVNNLETAAEKADLVIAVGFLFEKAIAEVAPKYEDTEFLFIDGFVENIPNLHSTTFADEQGSYLVGLIAGARSKADGSNKVGFVGGMEFDTILAFQAGFEAGVWETNPDAEIFVDYLGSFVDTTLAGQVASRMYNDGVNIIYHAAGDAGNGVITEAKNFDDKYVIGVDKDQYEAGKSQGEDSVVITSMLKGVDVAAYDFLEEFYVNKKITTGVYNFDVANDGIRAEISEGRNLDADEIALIKDYMAKIVSGEVTVSRTPEITGASGTKAK